MKLTSLAPALLLPLLFLGCGDSSSSGGGGTTTSDSTQGEEVTSAAVQAGAGTASLALQAALAQLTSAVPAPQTPPSLSVTGDASSGSATLDFGAGTTIYNATVSGAITSSWTRSGDSATVTLGFSSLSVTNAQNGTLLLSGDLSASVDLSGANPTGRLSGSLALSTSPTNGTSDSVSASFDVGYSLANTTLVLDSDVTLSSSRNGSWTLAMTSLTLDTSARAITSGTLTCTRTTGPSVTVTFAFTSANAGTLTVTPPGTSQPFSL